MASSMQTGSTTCWLCVKKLCFLHLHVIFKIPINKLTGFRVWTHLTQLTHWLRISQGEIRDAMKDDQADSYQGIGERLIRLCRIADQS